jgi:hypothetical protein
LGQVSTENRVDLETLTQNLAPKGSVREQGTFLQRSGVNLFYAMLILTAVILIALFLYLLIDTPAFSISPSSALDENTGKTLLQERQTVFTNFLSGIEKIVIAFCLPILTAILGYLFGTSEKRSNPTES